jgi:homoserine O-acetyltransferase
VQRRLLQRLGVARPLTAIGGSLGGMQALQWALDYPDELRSAILVCASARLSAQNIAFSEVARQGIMRDPGFRDGDYYDHPPGPAGGLATARMMAHITYLGRRSLDERFGRERREPAGGWFDVTFEVESYLRHQAEAFLRRFDANSYLYLSRLMDVFDPFAEPDAPARLAALADGDPATRFLLVSFDSDWRFDTSHSEHVARVLGDAGVPVEHHEVSSPHGHDSFLLPVPAYHRTVAAFVDRQRRMTSAASS